jgi:hypothetical protein
MGRAQARAAAHPLEAKHRSITEQHPELHVAAETVPQGEGDAAAGETGDDTGGREDDANERGVVAVLAVDDAEGPPTLPPGVISVVDDDDDDDACCCAYTASDSWLSTKSVTWRAEPWLGVELDVKSRRSVGVTAPVAGNVSCTDEGVTAEAAIGAPEASVTATDAVFPETVASDVSGTPLTVMPCVTTASAGSAGTKMSPSEGIRGAPVAGSTGSTASGRAVISNDDDDRPVVAGDDDAWSLRPLLLGDDRGVHPTESLVIT